MKKATMKTYIKESGKYVETSERTDRLYILENLSHDLISKKLHNAAYITKIIDKSGYAGERKITVYYNNDVKNVYTVEL